jgi:hypothetical protein
VVDHLAGIEGSRKRENLPDFGRKGQLATALRLIVILWPICLDDTLGSRRSRKSHLAQAIGHAVIQQGYGVHYREPHVLLEQLADPVVDGTPKEFVQTLQNVPLLIIDDFGMRKLPLTAAEDLLATIIRRYNRAGTLLTSNRPVEDLGQTPP